MSEDSTIDSVLTSNTIKAYYAFDEAMFKAHREDRNEYAESTARMLIVNADLPLLIRARACMVLGCCIDPDFLDMAKEGVRIAELGYSRCNNPGDFERTLAHSCKHVLEETHAVHDE